MFLNLSEYAEVKFGSPRSDRKASPEVRDARKRTQPDWFSPMLATLVDKPFSREGWIFESKRRFCPRFFLSFSQY
jgi:hypothetical protein